MPIFAFRRSGLIGKAASILLVQSSLSIGFLIILLASLSAFSVTYRKRLDLAEQARREVNTIHDAESEILRGVALWKAAQMEAPGSDVYQRIILERQKSIADADQLLSKLLHSASPEEKPFVDRVKREHDALRRVYESPSKKLRTVSAQKARFYTVLLPIHEILTTLKKSRETTFENYSTGSRIPITVAWVLFGAGTLAAIFLFLFSFLRMRSLAKDVEYSLVGVRLESKELTERAREIAAIHGDFADSEASQANAIFTSSQAIDKVHEHIVGLGRHVQEAEQYIASCSENVAVVEAFLATLPPTKEQHEKVSLTAAATIAVNLKQLAFHVERISELANRQAVAATTSMDAKQSLETISSKTEALRRSFFEVSTEISRKSENVSLRVNEVIIQLTGKKQS